MKLTVALSALLIAGSTALALANTIDSSLIPDGTYTVKVEKVVDAKHVTVLMDNGAETTLAGASDAIDFSKVKSGDALKMSIIKGAVKVYLDQSH